ncbi:MAG: moaC [Verrucomicrobiaceae bacterium]|nr:moaC [Verrucomicrobiaceae bacterium]
MHLTHTNDRGEASMVDVSEKPLSKRVAVAEARIILDHNTLILIQDNQIKKGDVLAVARIAGIQAAKQTALLIPLCHTLPLSKVSVDFSLKSDGITITTSATTISQTGVEMEALTAASIAALTIYDMCKAVDKTMRVEGLRLISKTKEAVG